MLYHLFATVYIFCWNYKWRLSRPDHVISYKLQTLLNYLSNSVNAFYIVNVRIYTPHVCRYTYNTRWTGNEWHGRLIRARNEVEFLLISQPGHGFPRFDVEPASEDLASKSNLGGYSIFGGKKIVGAFERKKERRLRQRSPAEESVP